MAQLKIVNSGRFAILQKPVLVNLAHIHKTAQVPKTVLLETVLPHIAQIKANAQQDTLALMKNNVYQLHKYVVGQYVQMGNNAKLENVFKYPIIA